MDSPLNALQNSSSAYLRSAMHQPVQWNEWGESAFEKAAAEDKPILLDIGAVWCHWCHVMDRESYENADTAALINAHFIAVKVDRDERPDVDSRYQAAVSAISGQGGWPLTAFLTPQGKPYFGGTYFPPDERMGRPSFSRVLQTMAHAFHDQRDQVNESAASVVQAVEYNEAFAGGSTDLENSSAGIALIDKLVASALQQFDPRHGGFGSQPKFPHPAALDMLTDAASRSGRNHEQAAEPTLKTLHSMFRGGIFDQLAGGFHRYSVDERWVVPHFEKMSYDNSELLRAYTHAFQTFVDPTCAEAATQILGWMDATLTDRVRGGFYSSQNADLTLDDDGDYFTWTRAEAAAVLTPAQLSIAELYFDIGAVGDMHHDPTRNVLFTPFTVEQVATRTNTTVDQAAQILAEARAALTAARLARPAPFVDKTLYTGWNSMAISAYLTAGTILRLPQTTAFALQSLDRALAAAYTPADADSPAQVLHVIAWGDPAAPASHVPGVLDDYVQLAAAALDGWQATGAMHYFNAAQAIADALLVDFQDHDKGGFFDTPADPNALGALTARRKPLQDSPTPAGNPAAASLLLRLYALTDYEPYRAAARRTLECFAAIVEHFGLYAATFALALGRLVRPAVQVVIVGEGPSAQELELVALARYAVNKTVLRFRPDQLSELPSALQQTLPHLLPAEPGTAVALVCVGTACQPPVSSAESLIETLAAVL